MRLKHGKRIEWHCLYWLFKCKYNNPDYSPKRWYPYLPLKAMICKGDN